MLTPFPLLSRLRINNRKKAILIVIFLLPLFVIAFAILRLVVTNAEGKTVDPIRLALFSTVEVSCCKSHPQYPIRRGHHNLIVDDCAAIIAACLPSIRLFFIPRSANSSRKQRSYGRRNEAPIDSLPREDTLPLQNLVKTRQPQDWTDSVESILRPEDKIYVRRDFLVSHGQI